MEITDEELDRRTKLQENIIQLRIEDNTKLKHILDKNKVEYDTTAKGGIMFDLILQTNEVIEIIEEFVDETLKKYKHREDNIEDEYDKIRQRLNERNQTAMVKRKTRSRGHAAP